MPASLPPAAVLALAVAGVVLLTAPPVAQLLPVPPRQLSSAVDPSPPAQPVKLVFVHHSVGENWLDDAHGGLGMALRDANYVVSHVDAPTSPPALTSGEAPPRLRRRVARGSGPLPSVLCPLPHPPLVTDVTVRQAPPVVEPPPRVPFRDPVFGSCLVLVSDRVGDRTPDDRQGGLKNEYARVQAFNADQSRFLLRSTVATWYLYDAATLRPLRRVEFWGDEPRWHPSDPQVFFYFQDTQLRAFDLGRDEDTLVHDFAGDFPGQSLSLVWTRWEGSPSRDGRWFGLMAQDQAYEAVALLVYDRLADRVTAVRDLRGVPNPTPDSATISPSGTYLVAQFEYCEHGTLGTLARPCGLMVYDRSLSTARGMARIIGHSDFALDAGGREVLVYQDVDTDEVAMLDLASGARTVLFTIDFSQAAHGFHFSGRAFDRPG